MVVVETFKKLSWRSQTKKKITSWISSFGYFNYPLESQNPPRDKLERRKKWERCEENIFLMKFFLLYLCLDEAFIFLSCHTFWVNSPLCMSYVSFVFCWFGRSETFLLSFFFLFFPVSAASVIRIFFVGIYFNMITNKKCMQRYTQQNIYRSVVNLNSSVFTIISRKYLLLIRMHHHRMTAAMQTWKMKLPSESWLAKLAFFVSRSVSTLTCKKMFNLTN
jgi:hypothetical protein